jgi:MFS family permease
LEVADLDVNRRIDWVGFVLFTVFMMSFMLGLTFSAYGLGSLNLVYVLLPVSVVFLLFFIVWQRRVAYPLLDLKLFRIREITGGVVAVLLNVIAWGAFLLLLSLQFQLVLGESPLQAGLRIIPFEIAFLIVGPLSGRLSDKYGYARFTLLGLVLGSAALFLFYTVGENVSYTILTVYMVLLGVGTGLFLAPNLRSVMGALPSQRRGIGSALVSLFLNIGLTLSLNLAILFMSLTAPYDIITKAISALNPASLSVADKAIFFSSLKNTYFALGVINALALIPSALQIGRKRGQKKVGKVIALEE